MFSRIINYTVKTFKTCKKYLPKNEKLNNYLKKNGYITLFLCTTPITFTLYSFLLGLSVNRIQRGFSHVCKITTGEYLDNTNYTYFERCMSMSNSYIDGWHYIRLGPFALIYTVQSFIIISVSYVAHIFNIA